jgi:poly-gamma-glutamate synthesis protein (capsule biosynthesis protein)
MEDKDLIRIKVLNWLSLPALIVSFFLLVLALIQSCFHSTPTLTDLARKSQPGSSQKTSLNSTELLKRWRKLANSETVEIVFVGDILMARGVDRQIKRHRSYLFPFQKVKSLIKRADISFGNLESPIISGRPVRSGSVTFRIDLECAEALKDVGFDVLSLANNHTWNYGRQGLLSTFKCLRKKGILYVGAGRDQNEAYAPRVIDSKGINVSFLAYSDPQFIPAKFEAKGVNPGIAFTKIPQMKKAISSLKSKTDWIIVSLHAGTEFWSTADKLQQEFARAAIDAGADLVIGHHPHVLQEAEIYKGKFIFYSLGNFVFDKMHRKETAYTALLRILIDKNQIQEIELIPIVINRFFQPEPVSGVLASKILKRFTLRLKKQPVIFWDGKSYRVTSRWIVSQARESFKRKGKIKVINIDLDSDGHQETIILEGKRLFLINQKSIIWQSSYFWHISDFAVGDIDGDSKVELLALVRKDWLISRFSEDSREKSQLYIFTFTGKQVEGKHPPKNMDRAVRILRVAELDGDPEAEIITVSKVQERGGLQRDVLTIFSWQGKRLVREFEREGEKIIKLTIGHNQLSPYSVLNLTEEPTE